MKAPGVFKSLKAQGLLGNLGASATLKGLEISKFFRSFGNLKVLKVVSAGIVVVFAQVNLSLPVFAETPVFDDPKIGVVFNGKTVASKNDALMIDGTAMIPLEMLDHGLGAQATYDPKTKVITIKKDNLTAKLTVGDDEVVVNVKLDEGAVLNGQDPMLPLRFVSELLGSKVEWNEAEHRVYVSVSGSGPVVDTTNAAVSKVAPTSKTATSATNNAAVMPPKQEPATSQIETASATTSQNNVDIVATNANSSTVNSSSITEGLIGDWITASTTDISEIGFLQGNKTGVRILEDGSVVDRIGTFTTEGDKITLNLSHLIKDKNASKSSMTVTYDAKLSENGQVLSLTQEGKPTVNYQKN